MPATSAFAGIGIGTSRRRSAGGSGGPSFRVGDDLACSDLPYSSGMIRFMNSSNIGTVNAVSPCAGE